MWESNKLIQHLYVNYGAQQIWAILEGVSGWKPVSPDSPDGVSNVGRLLASAKAHGRRVNVFLNNNRIERAVML